MLDSIMVDYYGSMTPLSQVANINTPDARTIAIQPWEKTIIGAIEKAIMSSNMGLNPATTGELIRIPLPPLTEERRKDMIKVVRAEGEGAKVAIRNIRRDVLSDIKSLLKDKGITEDEDHQAHDEVQKITDKYVKQVDEALTVKEKDLMEI